MTASPPAAYGYRALFTLAWPVVLARSAQAVIGFCDALMAAPLGEPQLAAVTTGALNVFSVVILPMGIAFIVQSFASQLAGKGDLVSARRYAWYGLMLAVAAGAVGLAAIPGVRSALGMFAYEAAVRDHMSDYLSVRLLSVGAIVGVEVVGNWYAGLGNTRLQMMAGIVAMVVNVALNWLLIGGNLGAPALGVLGAGIASVVASWVAFGCLVIVFAGRSSPGWTAEPLRLRMNEFTRMLRFGVPNGFNWFLEFGAFTVFINVVVAHLGTVTLAAMMVVIAINSVSFMPAFGVSSAGAILAGQAIGAGQKHRVPSIVRRTATVALSWQGAVGLVYLLAPAALMSWFAPHEQAAELLAVGTLLLAISAGWQLFDAICLTVGEALRAAGDTAWCLWARLGLAWLVFIPGAVLSVMVFDGGSVAAMLSMAGYVAALAIVLAWRFRTGAWQHIDLTGAEPELV